MRKKILRLFCVLFLLISVISSNPGFSVQAEVTENRVLFVSNRIGGVDSSDSNNEIYIMNQDGSNVLRLTNNYFEDGVPCWSPDATQIVFESMRDGNYEIYLMNADGSSQSNLTNNPAYVDKEPAWGPKIAFASNRDGLDEIYTINPDGTDLIRLTTNGGNSQPAWSPDGQKICYVSNGDIYVMNADGSGQTQLTNNLTENQWPAWSPDGTKIAYAANPNWDWEIYVMNADGSNPTNLTVSSVEDDTHPTWTQDGTKIYFQSHRDGNWDLYQMNSGDGGMQTRITKRAGDSFAPACFYNIEASKWTTPPDITIARTAVGVAAANEKIYAIGGYNISGSMLTTNEEYDPGTQEWTPRTPLPVASGYTQAISLNNLIYLVSNNINTISIYNPINDSWSSSPTPRIYSVTYPGVATWEGKIYLFGGLSPGSSYVQEYNPELKTWTSKASMPTARWALGAATVGNKIYAIGGSQSSNLSTVLATVEEYDPVTDMWDPTPKASLPIALSSFGIAVYQEKIYVIGGWNSGVRNTVYVYNPEINEWDTVENMPTARAGLGAAELNGVIYAVGGQLTLGSSQVCNTVEAFNP